MYLPFADGQYLWVLFLGAGLCQVRPVTWWMMAMSWWIAPGAKLLTEGLWLMVWVRSFWHDPDPDAFQNAPRDSVTFSVPKGLTPTRSPFRRWKHFLLSCSLGVASCFTNQLTQLFEPGPTGTTADGKGLGGPSVTVQSWFQLFKHPTSSSIELVTMFPWKVSRQRPTGCWGGSATGERTLQGRATAEFRIREKPQKQLWFDHSCDLILGDEVLKTECWSKLKPKGGPFDSNFVPQPFWQAGRLPEALAHYDPRQFCTGTTPRSQNVFEHRGNWGGKAVLLGLVWILIMLKLHEFSASIFWLPRRRVWSYWRHKQK